MTADEFVAALAEMSGVDSPADDVRGWGTITRRPRPLFEHPPDPVLDLLARYDVARIKFWQLAFSDRTSPDPDGLWPVARTSTDYYDVQDGQLLHMYYKAEYPDATGLTSGQFLDVLGVYAHMIAASAEQPSGRPNHALLGEYATQAAAVSPHATGLDWFRESSRR